MPPDSAQIPANGAPEWMIYAAFVLSVVNTLVVLVPIVLYLFRDAVLEFRLTRDLFFRISDLGETFFANGVYVAEGAPLKITNVTFRVSKTDASTKNYEVDVIAYGTKKISFGPSAEHHFDSSSPHLPLSADEVFRPLWHCVLTGYNTKIEEVVRAFDNDLLQLSQSDAFKLIQEDENTFKEMVGKAQAVVTHHAPEIALLVQLEPGTYRIEGEIRYQPRGGSLCRNQEKTARSAITFEVDEKVKEQYKARIQSWLEDRARAVLFDRNHRVRFPEYQPLDRVEVN